jgi:hypothetical protein
MKQRKLSSKARRETEYVLGGLAGVIAFLIIGVFSVSIFDTYLLRNTSLASVISSVLVDLANGDRGAEKIGGLTVSPVLTAAAQAKADDMAAKGYFAHTSPDGKSSWYWFQQAGYTFLYAGENLAVDFSDSNDVEQAWMNSPTHRANILDDHFTQIGIATAQGTFDGHRTTFVVQMFGTPAAHAAPVTAAVSPKEPTAPAVATTKPVVVAPAVKKVSAVAVASTTPTAAVASAVAEKVLGAEADSILPPAPASWWQHLLASPKVLLEYFYIAVSIAVLAVLAFVTELEFHKRHLRHVAVVLLLFVFMTGLFFFADAFFFSSPVIAAL